jgi:hypothetical protein
LTDTFIAEPVEVVFDTPPTLSKKPPCPDGFVWRDESFAIVELLAEWRDTGRRGQAAHNMRPEHLTRAARTGSWGVGRTTFRVRTADGRIFELTYDRAPKGRDGRHGTWHLYKQIEGS